VSQSTWNSTSESTKGVSSEGLVEARARVRKQCSAPELSRHLTSQWQPPAAQLGEPPAAQLGLPPSLATGQVVAPENFEDNDHWQGNFVERGAKVICQQAEFTKAVLQETGKGCRSPGRHCLRLGKQESGSGHDGGGCRWSPPLP
jgi:hypothetical protein